jgi:hypothetical protein
MVATGTPTGPLAVSEGIANQDFSITGGTRSQDAQVTVIGQQCAATVVFAPKYPGVRQGAVVIKTPSGTLLGTALVAGLGTGSLAVLDPGDQHGGRRLGMTSQYIIAPFASREPACHDDDSYSIANGRSQSPAGNPYRSHAWRWFLNPE